MASTPAPVVLAGGLGGLLSAGWRGGAPAPTSLLGSSAFLKRNVLLITPSNFLLGSKRKLYRSVLRRFTMHTNCLIDPGAE